MGKYLRVFVISFQQEFAYRLNFVMWRVRNVIQIFIIFFLWDTVFSDPKQELFGYNRDKILTYVFGIIILRALIFSARAVDVSGEISRGEIMNYLIKPLNYFKYWLTRDLSSKALNIIFAVFETAILYLILRPPFYLQTNLTLIVLFILSVIIALLLYFFLLMLVNMIGFWAPEAGWAGQFLFLVIITEFFSGAIFPIDILPGNIQQIVYSTPFPYLLFFPLQIYLGKISMASIGYGLMIASVWLIVLVLGVKYLWNKGLKEYEAFGR